MSRATKHARHEVARKHHRKEAKAHARELEKRPREQVALWFLAVGVAAILVLVVGATAIR
jgi:hypothetical protein